MSSTTTFSSKNFYPHHMVKAADFLRHDKLVAFPTETVYGLGGNALSDSAVASIYETKGRPTFNPLIVHVPSLQEATKYVVFNDTAKKLAEIFWPGPLTLVLPRRPDCTLSLLVSAGLDTVAIRVPAHPLAQALLKECGLPLAAPSANKSGHVSPTLAAHVREEFGDTVMILDGGACPVGIESTVVDMSEDTPVILRPGSITEEEINNVLRHRPNRPCDSRAIQKDWIALEFCKNKIRAMTRKKTIKSPGMLERHYAPNKKLRLNATDVKPGEALLAFGTPLKGASIIENLSAKKDLKEAAANLFKMLRVLDASNATSIAVMPIPEEGLGVAINDRLRRAAT